MYGSRLVGLCVQICCWLCREVGSESEKSKNMTAAFRYDFSIRFIKYSFICFTIQIRLKMM